MMKRSAVLLAVVLTIPLAAARASAPGSPEDVVERAFDAFNHGKLDLFVRAMHPDALVQFRAMVLDVLDAAVKHGKQDEVLKLFQDVSKADDLKAFDGARMMTALLSKATVDPDMKQALASTRIEAVGRLAEGSDKAYVVYRSKIRANGLDLDRLNVSAVLKSGSDWKLALADQTVGRIAILKQGLAGEAKLPDMSASKVEPLGHVMDGKKTAMVVYRTLTPVGDVSLPGLGVVKVDANDAAWDAVRKGDKPSVLAFLEKSLGFRGKPEPAVAASTSMEPGPRAAANLAPQLSPEEIAARRAEGMKRLEEMKARMESTRGNGRPSVRKSTEAVGGALPGGLTALPASFFGGDRDRFYDMAPKGGVLVGVRVSYIAKMGGHKVSSVRPVYRVGQKLVDGKRYGTLLGKEEKAIAKDGYAVGAVNTHTGITVDGFELVFMKVDGDRLDASDAYNSPWLGDTRGGSPRNVSSDGKVPAGLQGRSGNEVNALGLIVPE